jgi:hypothetical protein
LLIAEMPMADLPSGAFELFNQQSEINNQQL